MPGLAVSSFLVAVGPYIRKEERTMDTSRTVRDVLRKKGNSYWGVPPSTMAYDALELMAEKNIGALLVVDRQRLVGIFSERDYARKVILKGKSSRTTTVEELMSSPPICARLDMTIHECMVLMSKNQIRHLPVLDDGAIRGVLSVSDVVTDIIDTQEATIHQLEGYIRGDDVDIPMVGSGKR
jgi:signal-transduction protein with cAMP-binding, CBS, and nucleotidyltransferase domain